MTIKTIQFASPLELATGMTSVQTTAATFCFDVYTVNWFMDQTVLQHQILPLFISTQNLREKKKYIS
jgi:hypothetical protein